MLIYFLNDGEVVNTDNCAAIEFKYEKESNLYRIIFTFQYTKYWYAFKELNEFNKAKNKIINAQKKHLKYLEIDNNTHILPTVSQNG